MTQMVTFLEMIRKAIKQATTIKRTMVMLSVTILTTMAMTMSTMPITVTKIMMILLCVRANKLYRYFTSLSWALTYVADNDG